jgi:hypothetical protein
MVRYLSAITALSCALAGCTTDDVETSSSLDQQVTLSFHREHVTADIYHYELVLPVGSGPNAGIRVHRVVRELAPFVPRHSSHAAMLMHGDFATFATSFVPGMAPYLAARNIDVWGVDRRWTLPAAAGDVSDLATMGVVQEVDDIRVALAFARALRLAGGDGSAKLALVGFSHGAQLAYTYAAVEAARPAAQRHVGALVPLDWYGAFDPSQTELRDLTCDNSAFEYQLVADGVIDSPNDFFITLGELAASDPNGPSPLFDDLSNRAAMLLTLGQTYVFAPFAPVYHLLSPILEDDAAVGLRETSEAAAIAWLSNAPPHQSMLEAADLDALLCPSAAQPVDARLSRIRVPLLYIGAAGGIGSLGVYATTQVSSTDVSTLVVQRFGAERRAEDFGHGDLLFAHDAPALVWQPLASWLAHH